jgi:hypothetical protein
MPAGDSKKPFVQVSTQPTTAIAGVDTDEVDVGLVRSRLGQKTNEKTYEPVLINDDKARISEMLKEQTGHKRNPLAPSSRLRIVPPLVQSDNHIGMILFGRRSKCQLAHMLDPTHQSAFTHYRAVARAGLSMNEMGRLLAVAVAGARRDSSGGGVGCGVLGRALLGESAGASDDTCHSLAASLMIWVSSFPLGTSSRVCWIRVRSLTMSPSGGQVLAARVLGEPHV